jgi:drug/metabolite transporter (DMT)-like permease
MEFTAQVARTRDNGDWTGFGAGMAEGVGLALGTMIFYGLADWVYKRAAASGVQAHHFLPLQAFFFAPGIFLYGLATGTLVFGTAFAWGMSAGVLVFVALYNFARSLASGAVSIVAPVFRLSFCITAALAVWLLDEPLTRWKLAGLASALAAVWLLLGGGGAAPAPRATTASVVRVLVATVAMGLVSFVYKLGALAGGSPATVLTGQASVFLPLATLFAVARDRGFRPPPGGWRYGATTAVLLLFGLVMLLAGLARGEASVLVPVAQLSFVVTAGLGILILREPLTPRKSVGLAFAVAALVCLARS